ncbi:ABC-three component system protein [Dermabacteraceae bacterium P13115]
MAQMTPFSRVIAIVRPLMQGTRSLGKFTAELIDMGMQPAQDPNGARTALEFRSVATWKGYANGSAPMPADVASEIAGRWDEVVFGINVADSYSETALISLVGNLQQLDASINKGNCAEGLGRLLYNTFVALSGEKPVALPPKEAAVVRIEQAGHPYFDQSTNRIRLGEYSREVPSRREVPDEVQEEELAYVTPLLEAYCEEQYKVGTSVTVEDIPKRLAAHFQEQRQAFYSAEWLKETSWNCIHDGEAVFETWLDNMHAGVNDTHLRNYQSAVDRLMETLAQSTRVQLDGVRLAQIISLIDVWVRKGSCHELAARQKLRWVNW